MILLNNDLRGTSTLLPNIQQSDFSFFFYTIILYAFLEFVFRILQWLNTYILLIYLIYIYVYIFIIHYFKISVVTTLQKIKYHYKFNDCLNRKLQFLKVQGSADYTIILCPIGYYLLESSLINLHDVLTI